MNSYELSRTWFDFCFENPEKISPNHSAIYFFAIEHCNRLGWKEKFGFPTQMTMDALGIKKHQTYIKYFNELVDWGFFKMIQKSSNQYSSNIISLSIAKPKNGKALDKAFINHTAKQTQTNRQTNRQTNKQSTRQSISSIDKQINNLNNLNNLNNKQFKQGTSILIFPFDSEDFKRSWNLLSNQKKWKKKEDSALQAALKKLSKESELDAIKMLENAITGEWQGIHELKPHEKSNYGKKTANNDRHAGAFRVGKSALDRLAEIERNNNAAGDTG